MTTPEKRYVLTVLFRNGASWPLSYNSQAAAEEAMALYAEMLSKTPADRAGAHIVTRDVPRGDGVVSLPLQVIDFREVVAASYAELQVLKMNREGRPSWRPR